MLSLVWATIAHSSEGITARRTSVPVGITARRTSVPVGITARRTSVPMWLFPQLVARKTTEMPTALHS